MTLFLEQFLEQIWQSDGLLDSRYETVGQCERPQRELKGKNWSHYSLRPLTNANAIDAPTAKTNTASMPANRVSLAYSNQQLSPVQPLPMST